MPLPGVLYTGGLAMSLNSSLEMFNWLMGTFSMRLLRTLIRSSTPSGVNFRRRLRPKSVLPPISSREPPVLDPAVRSGLPLV